MAGYDPDAIRRRLEAERANVAANLAAWQLQMERNPRPSSWLIPDAIAAARRQLGQIEVELAALPAKAGMV